MRIAFYAPLKPPTHGVPSGDRRMARLLSRALTHAGHEVELASRLRSRDGVGDAGRQAHIEALGARLAARLVRRYEARAAGARPALWFTYHLYHKAPDWLGPTVSRALAIPYVVAEASFAPKQAGGPWDLGHRASRAAIAEADLVLAFTAEDEAALRPLVPEGRLARLTPFIDAQPFAAAAGARARHRRALAARYRLDPGRPWLLAVAMMREGDKLASYRALARALAMLDDADWTLLVVGDGPARGHVETAFAPFGPTRVRFAGAEDPDALAPFHAAADLLVWPAHREAYGMAILEAQAAGLPVVAGRTGGVGEIVCDGETGRLVDGADPAAFAAAVRDLLREPGLREAMGAAARARVRAAHNLATASDTLDRLLRPLADAAS